MSEEVRRGIEAEDITAHVDPFKGDIGVHSQSGPYSSDIYRQLMNKIFTVQGIIDGSDNEQLKKSIDFEKFKIDNISYNISEFLDQVSKFIINALNKTQSSNREKNIDKFMRYVEENRGKLLTKESITEALDMADSGIPKMVKELRVKDMENGVELETIRAHGYVYGTAEERTPISEEYKAKPREKSNRVTKTDKVLTYFIENRGKLLTRGDICKVSGIDKESAITPHIVKLRKKDLGEGILIDTVYGQGFVYGTQEERDKIHDEYKTVKISSNRKNENFEKFFTLFEENISEVFSKDNIFNRTQLPKTSFPQYVKKMKEKFGTKEKMFDNIRGKGYILGSEDQINEKRRELGVYKRKDKLFSYFLRMKGDRRGVFITRRDICVDLKTTDANVHNMIPYLDASIAEYNREKGVSGNKSLEYSITSGEQRGYYFGTRKAVDDRRASKLAGTYVEEITEKPEKRIESKKIKKGVLGSIGNYNIIINQDNISFGGLEISFDSKKHDFLHLVILNAINGAPTSKQFLEKKKGMNPSGYEISINKIFEEAGIKLEVLTVGSFGDYTIKASA